MSEISRSVSALWLAGCTSSNAGTLPDAVDLDANVEDASAVRPDASSAKTAWIVSRACPGAVESSDTIALFDSLKRPSDAGSTAVEIVFCNPLLAAPTEEFLFYLVLENHLGIPRSDLTASWVQTDAGRTGSPLVWDGPDLTLDDHHAVGHLRGPNTTAAGVELLGPPISFLALHVSEIGREDEVVLRWEAEAP